MHVHKPNKSVFWTRANFDASQSDGMQSLALLYIKATGWDLEKPSITETIRKGNLPKWATACKESMSQCNGVMIWVAFLWESLLHVLVPMSSSTYQMMTGRRADSCFLFSLILHQQITLYTPHYITFSAFGRVDLLRVL